MHISSLSLSSCQKIGRLAAAAALLLACALIPAVAQRALAQTSAKSSVPSYRDPQGRFTLQIPQGWSTTQMNNDAVQFSRGAAYVTMLVLPGTDPAMVIGSIGDATGKQWKNFAEARRGTATFGGQTGQYVTYSGVNPMGSDSYLQLLDMTDGSLTYLLMTSAPKADFTKLKSAFDQIEHSFKLTASAKVPDGLPPAPAGALETSQSPMSKAPAQPIAQLPNPSQPREAVAPASQGAASKPLSGGGHVYQMKLVRIVDEHGFERPMTALTLLIPVDWQFQGAVQYAKGVGCHANLVHLAFRATSPDGRLAMELFPSNSWQWTDDANMRNMMQTSNQQMARFGGHGCDIMAPMTADAYLRRHVLPAVRRDAHVTGSEPMRDVAQQLQQEAQQTQQAAARQGLRVNIRTDVSRVRVSYTQNGGPVEEWFTAITSATSLPGPSFNVRTGRSGQVLYYSNAADHVFAMRAPQGQLDAQEKFFQLIMANVHVDPQWQARVQQVIANMQAQDSKSAMDRSAIATKSGQDTSKIIHDTYENTTKTHDRAMETWSQYMRGVQPYRNPNTGETVELSNQYGHAWAGPNNTYVLSDSPNFDPNTDRAFKGNWTPLEPVQH
jgi:hypothetical protein